MNQQSAQGLAALGRGPDTMLVHMAPQEVAGLQALALKHGGSLTINPETGLPEAGFLSSILPMVLGAGLAATGIGAPMAAMLVGGGYGVAKGSLKEGLMAGLGAYGGAGLGAGLMGAGAGAAGTAGTAAAASEFAGTQAGLQQNALTSLGIPSNAAAGTGAMSFTPSATTNLLGNAANVAGPMSVPVTTSQLVGGIPQVVTATAMPVPAMAPTFSEGLSQMGSGLKDVFSSGDKALAFAKENAYPLGAVGLSALAGMQPKALKASPQNQGMIRPYTYSREKVPNAFMDVAGEPLSSKERRYFTDRYTALTPYKAPGPEYMAAEGGPVADMSNGNDMAAYMGRDKFAEGGSIGGYTFDPRTGIYTKPSGEGATVASPTGGASRASGEGNGENPMLPQTIDFLDKETPGERNERMENVSNVIGMLVPGGLALQTVGNLASGLLSSPTVGAIANFFGGTQAPAPVEDAVGNMTPFGNNVAIGQMMANIEAADTAEEAANNAGAGGFDSDFMAQGGLAALAQGGISNLGDYSDGGRLLRGPGDGVSDDIPAMIGQKQQARLADGEFVVPARIVSELGNGSTEAGARQLYAMMDRVQKARKKTVGKDKVATNSRAAKLLPA